MTDDVSTSHPDLLELATELTIAWLANPNTRASGEEVPAFLEKMHGAVAAIAGQKSGGEAEANAQVEYTPAVSVRRSLASKDHIISLIDGKPYKSLKRHLSTQGLTPAEYRRRYGLKADYPMVAENYSASRREIAKKLGLGRKPAAKADTAPAAASAAPAEDKPATAAKAINPAKPAKTEKAAKTEKPAKATKRDAPAEAAKPARAAKPANAAKPKADAPAQAGKPAAAAKSKADEPAQTDKPAAAAKPVIAAKPAKQAQADAPAQADKPAKAAKPRATRRARTAAAPAPAQAPAATPTEG